MDLGEILLSIVFTVAVGAGVSLTPSAISAAEVWGARGCFTVAALSLLFCYGRWLQLSLRNPQVTNTRRIAIGVLIFLLSANGLALGITWIGKRESYADAQTRSQAQAQLSQNREQERVGHYQEVILQLSKFESEASALLYDQIPESRVAEWRAAQEKLANEAALWTERNMGVEAKTRLLDMSGFPPSNHADVADLDRRERLVWLDKFNANMLSLEQDAAKAAAVPLP